MAGPWFAVHDGRGGWTTLDDILVSDGAHHVRARVQARVTLDAALDGTGHARH